MKKWLTYGLSIIFFSISILLLIERKEMLDQVDIKIFFVDEFEEESYQTIKFCAFDRYDNFDLIDIVINEQVNDVYLYVFDLYNIRRNTLPTTHEVVSSNLLTLITFVKDEDRIFIILEDINISEEQLMRTLYAMNITYRFLGIKEVVIEVNNTTYHFQN